MVLLINIGPNIKLNKDFTKKNFINLSKNDINISYLKNIEKLISKNNKQYDDYISNFKEYNTINNNIIYDYIEIINKSKNKVNKFNIIKLFYDLEVYDEIPFIKLVLNTNKESYYKLYTDNIDSSIDKSTCNNWIRGDYITINNYIKKIKNYANTIVIILYISKNTYAKLEINNEGNITYIIEKNDKINNKKYIDKVNSFINKYIKYNEETNGGIYGEFNSLKTNFENNDINYIDLKIEYDKNNLIDKNGNNYDLIDSEGNKSLSKYRDNFINYFNNLNSFVKCESLPKNKTDDENDLKIIKLKYKQVNNYYNLNNIEQEIILLYNDIIKGNRGEINDIKNEIKNIIKEQFSLDEQKSNDIVKSILQDIDKKKKVNKYKQDLYVTSNLNSGCDIILKIEPNTEKVIFEITNITTFNDKNNIINFLNYFIYKYINFLNGKDTELFTKIDKKNLNIEDEIIKDRENIELQETEIEFTQNTAENEIIDSDEELMDLEFDQFGGTDPLLKRLKQYDKNLISWKAKDYDLPLYSTLCQNSHNRLPVVVTNEELEIINQSDKLNSGQKSYGKKLKVGSTKELENENNYICPIYWDTQKNLSLDPNNLPSNIEQLIKDKIVIKRKHSYWKTSGEDVNNYIPIDTSLIDNPWKHPEGLHMPCCFSAKENKEKKEKDEKIITKSLLLDFLEQNNTFNVPYIKKISETSIKLIMKKDTKFFNNIKNNANTLEKYKTNLENINKLKDKDIIETYEIKGNKKDVINKNIKLFNNLIKKEINRINLFINKTKVYGYTEIKTNTIIELIYEIIKYYDKNNKLYYRTDKNTINKCNYNDKIKNIRIFTDIFKNKNGILEKKIDKLINDYNIDTKKLNIKNIIKEQIKDIENNELYNNKLIEYRSDDIKIINLKFIKYLIKDFIVDESKINELSYNLIYLLQNHGYLTKFDKEQYMENILEKILQKDVIEEDKENIYVSKNIWNIENYGLPTSKNESTDGKVIHKLFLKYIDIFKYNKQNLIDSKDVKNFINNIEIEDIYYILREYYYNYYNNKYKLTKEKLENINEYEKNNKKYKINKDIITSDFLNNINSYFNYYQQFTNIMYKIFNSDIILNLRIDIQNIFINYKKDTIYDYIINNIIISGLRDNEYYFNIAGDGIINKSFNNINNYIDYIKDKNIIHNDIYILPIINEIIPEFKNINFIVFEEFNNSLHINTPLDKLSYINTNNEDNKYCLINKKGNTYKLLLYNQIIKYNSYQSGGNYEEGYNKGYDDGYNNKRYDVEDYDENGYDEGYTEGAAERMQENICNININLNYNNSDIIDGNIIKISTPIISKKDLNIENLSHKMIINNINNIEKIIRQYQNYYNGIIPKNIFTFKYLIDKKIINKNTKYYINNNIITHIINDEYYYPIYPCGLKAIEYYLNNINLDNLIISKSNNKIPEITFKNSLNKIKNLCKDNAQLEDGYNIQGYIADKEKNVVFNNNTYIPIDKIDEKNILGYINLFELDNIIEFNIPKENKIISDINEFYIFKDKIIKNILHNNIKINDNIKKALEIKNIENIKIIFNEIVKQYINDKNIYRIIDMMYIYGWPSWNTIEQYIYILPEDFKENINNEKILYFIYNEYIPNKEEPNETIIDKYFNKKYKYYNSLNIYDDNKPDDFYNI